MADAELVRLPDGSLVKPHAIADIEFIATNHGGRQTPIAGGLFRCPLLYHGELFDVGLFLHNVGPISPGEWKEGIPMEFLSPHLLAGRIRVGDMFGLRELRVTAFGKFTQVFI